MSGSFDLSELRALIREHSKKALKETEKFLDSAGSILEQTIDLDYGKAEDAVFAPAQKPAQAPAVSEDDDRQLQEYVSRYAHACEEWKIYLTGHMDMLLEQLADMLAAADKGDAEAFHAAHHALSAGIAACAEKHARVYAPLRPQFSPKALEALKERSTLTGGMHKSPYEPIFFWMKTMLETCPETPDSADEKWLKDTREGLNVKLDGLTSSWKARILSEYPALGMK